MDQTPNTAYYYLARKPCGCACAYISADNDTEDKRKLIARRTGEWHRAKYTVEYVTEEIVQRDYPPHCTHGNGMHLIFE